MSRPKHPGDVPVTDAHRRTAFALFAWHGWTFEAAMADDTRRRLINCRAAWVRTREFEETHGRGTETVRRFNPTTGAWCSQRIEAGWTDQTPIAA